MALLTVRSLVDDAVRRYEEQTLTAAESAAVKLAVHRSATTAVDQVGRAFGTASVWHSHAWQRYFRDLRVGAHNSPPEDVAIDGLARQVLEDGTF